MAYQKFSSSIILAGLVLFSPVFATSFEDGKCLPFEYCALISKVPNLIDAINNPDANRFTDYTRRDYVPLFDVSGLLQYYDALYGWDSQAVAYESILQQNDSLGNEVFIGQNRQNNVANSLNWSKFVADQRLINAQNYLGLLFGNYETFTNPHTNLDFIFTGGDEAADDTQSELGVMFAHGLIIQAYLKAIDKIFEEYPRIIKRVRLAAQEGDPYAQMQLGLMYLHGLGTAPDLVRAHMWENTSALIGNKQAIKYRASISGRLNLEELDAAQKMAKDCLATKFTGCE